MATSSMNFTGIEEMLAQIDTMDDRMNRGKNKVLKESADPLRVEIRNTTPVSEVVVHKNGETHAKDDVEIGGIKQGERGSRDHPYVDVGYTKGAGGTAWRMYFVELGTIYQRPQYIVTNAIDNASDKVLSYQADGLRELIMRS